MVEEDRYSCMALEDAIDLFVQGQYNKSIGVIKYHSDKNNAQALAKLGLAFQLGFGVPINIEKAIHYLTKAANLGSGEAAHNLGTLYATQPKMNSDQAKEWFIKAKELGFDPSNGEL